MCLGGFLGSERLQQNEAVESTRFSITIPFTKYFMRTNIQFHDRCGGMIEVDSTMFLRQLPYTNILFPLCWMVGEVHTLHLPNVLEYLC